jgi:hypothetical protein
MLATVVAALRFGLKGSVEFVGLVYPSMRHPSGAGMVEAARGGPGSSAASDLKTCAGSL